MMKFQMLLSIALFSLFISCRSPTITEATLEVAPQTKKCVGNFGGPREPNPNRNDEIVTDCIQVRNSPQDNYRLSSGINGFVYEPGFSYQLRVRNIIPNSGMMDDFGYTELIAILEKTPVSN